MADEGKVLKIYDETSKEEIHDPDLTVGYLYDGQIKTGTKPQEVVVMDGTITERNPDGLRKVIPVRDIYEQCQYYHVYTEEEVSKLRTDKISELKSRCDDAIQKGSTVQLSDESTKEFSYGLEDQSNVSEMFNAVIMGATSYPYHANGESCKMYSAQDITKIYSTLSGVKTSHITYYNQLRAYVESLEKAGDIKGVYYGQELTGAYLETYNTLLEQAKEQMQTVLVNIATFKA